jgi:S-(hydroxymethyl)glutathione dehydrogenase/alcohol dehydrogenase
MKAAVFLDEGLAVRDVDLDGPGDGEIRIRVVASGLCHSDYHVISGSLPVPRPIIMGHEAAGVVEAVGHGVPRLRVGDFVVTCFSSYCGQCVECQTGHNHRCVEKPLGPPRAAGSRITLDGQPVWEGIGGFAEEMVVHHRAVVKLPADLPPASAALLGCGVLTGVGAALNRAKITPSSRVAVIGCGGVGLNVIQGARIAGAAEIIAIDRNPRKLPMAKEFGATAAVQAGPDAVGTVLEMTKGGVDFAFEAIGAPAAMRDAFLMLRMHGTAVIIGLAGRDEEMSFPVYDAVEKDKRIVVSAMGDAPFQLFVPELVRLYREGTLKLDELVSNKIGLSDIAEGFKAMETGDVARSVIVF